MRIRAASEPRGSASARPAPARATSASTVAAAGVVHLPGVRAAVRILLAHRHQDRESRLEGLQLAVQRCNTKGYSSTYLAMGFAKVRAGTQKRRGP